MNFDTTGPRERQLEANGDDELLQPLPLGKLLARSIFGGALMGLANLVPGISGGTMLLAAGIYPAFIDGVAELTRLRFRFRSLAVLAVVGAAATLAILLLAGQLKAMVVEYRWLMYSLFIGLTLGGIPVVWKMAKPVSRGLVTAAIVFLVAMVTISLLQAHGVIGSTPQNPAMLWVAGVAGASAMILPGISGGYLLLLMGQYVPILTAIDQFKDALRARDFLAATEPALTVMLPVGLGVLMGIALVGNLLQWFLHHHHKATLGALLGLLMGSTVGLFPFQQPIPPSPGQTIKGQLVTHENQDSFEVEDWNTEYFRPRLDQVAMSLGLIGMGFGITWLIARVGNDEPPAPRTSTR